MNLILSGEYCSQELCNEIGFLPPTFLPMGDKRLYELQFEIIKKFEEETFLSLPQSFQLPEFDKRKLDQLNINLVFVPPELTLSESLEFCIQNIDVKSHLRLLHGDTLFDYIPDVNGNFFF